MYILSASAAFDSAHFLKGYEGKCSQLHGHRWTIEAEVYSETLQTEGPTRGMVVDFKMVKNALKRIADHYDHAFIYETGTISACLQDEMMAHGFQLVAVDFVPTAECFAKNIYDTLTLEGLNVNSTTVFETPTNKATYKPLRGDGHV